MDLIKAYIHPDDIDLIKGMAISPNLKSDPYGWHFTTPEKYSVKSRYRAEKIYSKKV